MKTCIILLSFLIAPAIGIVAQTFEQKADFPGGGRFGAVRFVIDDEVYVGLGEAGAGNYPIDFYRYDGSSGQWTPIADFPGGGREFGIGYANNGKGYVGLGSSFIGANTTVFEDFWQYDPQTNSWTQLGNFDGGKRAKAIAFSVGGSAYIGTGITDQFEDTNDFWKYDPANDSWILQPDMSNFPARFGATFAVLNDKAYMGGGAEVGPVKFSDLWVFDPANASQGWMPLQDDPSQLLAFESGAGFGLGDKVYFGYGLSKNYVVEFDLLANSATDLGDLLGVGDPLRYGPIGFAMDGKGYIGLGYTNVAFNQASEYENDLWEMSVPSSVESPEKASNSLIFPNPAKGVFQVKSTGKFLSVYDLHGRAVVPVQPLAETGSVDLSHCPAGVYLVRIDEEIFRIINQKP